MTRESDPSLRHRHSRRRFRREPRGSGILEPPAFTLTLPNYGMTPIGQTAGLEGGAFVARANDASSNWYNPAGLALAEKSSVSSSAGTYQSSASSPKTCRATTREGPRRRSRRSSASSSRISSATKRWTAGFAAVRTNSFEQETDAQRSDLLSSARGDPGLLGGLPVPPQRIQPGPRLLVRAPGVSDATLAVANTSLRAVGSVFDQQIEPGGLDADVARAEGERLDHAASPCGGRPVPADPGDPARSGRPHARPRPVPERGIQLRRPSAPRRRDRESRVLRSGPAIRLQAALSGRGRSRHGVGALPARGRRHCSRAAARPTISSRASGRRLSSWTTAAETRPS